MYARRSTNPRPAYHLRADGTKKTGFDNLPGELRNRIYREALVEDQSIVLVTRCSGSIHGYYKKGAVLSMAEGQPALIRASKLTRKEASSIYYLENRFVFQDSTLVDKAIYAFMDQAGRCVPKMKSIQIRRNVQIGNMKQLNEISLTVSVDAKANKLIIKRPPYVPKVFVPGMVRIKSKLTEPCRCKVDHEAAQYASRRKLDGGNLFGFLTRYCMMINGEPFAEFIDICKKCGTMCWN